MMNQKEYLGDSVYINWDGYSIELTTENGYGPTNTITLDAEVVEGFMDFLERVENFVKDHPVE